MMIVSFINYLYPLFMRYYLIKVCAFLSYLTESSKDGFFTKNNLLVLKIYLYYIVYKPVDDKKPTINSFWFFFF